MIDQNTYEHIEQYLDGELPEMEVLGFEKRIEEDQVFKEAVEDVMKLRHAAHSLLKENYEEKFSQWREEEGGIIRPIRARSRQRYMAVAAVVLLLLTSVVLFINRPSSEPVSMQQLYTMNDAPLKPSGTRTFETDNETKDIWLSAIQLYGKGQYEEAAVQFNQMIEVISDKSELDQPLLYLGTCYLFTEKTELALETLEKVDEGSESSYQADWYISLAYLKMEDKNHAMKALKKITTLSFHPKKTEAEEILRHLEKIQ